MENRVYVSQLKKFAENKLGEPLEVVMGAEVDTDTNTIIRDNLYLVKKSDGIAKIEYYTGEEMDGQTKYFNANGEEVYRGEYKDVLFLFRDFDFFLDEENKPFVTAEGCLNGVVCFNGLGGELAYSIPSKLIEEIKNL